MPCRIKAKVPGLGFAVCVPVFWLAAQQPKLQEINARILVLQSQQQFAEAARLAKESVAIAEGMYGKDNASLTTTLDHVAGVLKAQGDYKGAEPYYERGRAILEKALGKGDANVAAFKNNLAEVYRLEGRYREAERLFQEALPVLQKSPGRALDYAASLNNLGLVYEAQGRYAEADPLQDAALEIRTRMNGPTDPLVADSLNNVGQLRRDQGKYAEAAVLYRRAIAIYTKAGGSESPEIAPTLNNLGAVYWAQGRYQEAEQSYRRALAIDEKVSGEKHPDVATDLNNLATLLHSRDKYAEAEQLSRRALAIDEAASPGPNPAAARDLSNVATIYQERGRYREAEEAYRKALDIDLKALGEDHEDTARILNNLGALCEHLGEAAPCGEFYRRALAINEKMFGKDHPNLAPNLNNLGEVYLASGKVAEAEPLFRRAVDILKAATDREDPLQGSTLTNLAMVYQEQKKYAEAERTYQQALAIDEALLGKDNYSVSKIQHNLATLYYEQGKFAEAGVAWDRSLGGLQSQFESQFEYMSEEDRLSFLATAATEFPLYLSFCYSNREHAAEFAGKMYNLLLWQKGLVANGITAVRSEIAASGDPAALAMFEQLSAERAKLAKLRNPPDGKTELWKQEVQALQEQSNALETTLVQRFGTLGQKRMLARATWQDVARALKPGEAAVEFVHFDYHDGHRWTKKSYYAALVLTAPVKQPPALVVLGEGNELEKGALSDYRDRVGTTQPEAGAGVKFYQAFWKPLEGALTGVKRVYISPDGILHTVSWSAVPTDDGRLLTDKYDADVLLSTKDLLINPQHVSSRSAVLVGNPNFDLDEAGQRTAVAALQQAEARKAQAKAPAKAPAVDEEGSGLRSRNGASGRLDPLPRTEAEIVAVQGMLEKKGWQVEAYSREAALEEAVKHVSRPRVLHIATHGFFEADQETPNRDGAGADLQLEDPMLRSGLYLAGANRLRTSGQAAADLDDGVLTAYEVTGLHLQGTELVVLSACETGLGVVANGEGVFGLRRALQEAGAEAVLMSLWPVPDAQTQRLMALFYEYWLAGKEKHDALHLAQQDLRKELQAQWGDAPPYYWAAFVLSGR